MEHRFTTHYTRDEARALLPHIRKWLRRLQELRGRFLEVDPGVSALIEGGRDAGGGRVNQWVRTLLEMREVLGEFQRRELQIKDLERGLVDFPTLLAGKEVFLCWEEDEADIEYWHDLETGYGGREPL